MKNIVQVFGTAVFLILVCNIQAVGQQSQYSWKIGASGGVFSYFGDLTDKFRLVQPNTKTIKPLANINFESYGWSAERSLSSAWTLGFGYNKGEFIANDRQIGWNGELQTHNKYFSRSLNAKTKLKNYNLFIAYYMDNGSFFRKKAKFVPYAKLGVGLTSFSVFGDLFTNEQRYYYWPDGTIRNIEPGSPNSTIVSQDGVFESDLTKLKTEGKKYKTNVFTPSLGLGFKLRISQKINVNLEYGVFFTETDYLDDVADKYPTHFDSELQRYASNPSNSTNDFRGNPDGKNDLFTFSSISLQYSFAKKPTAFQAPIIHTGSFFLPASESPMYTKNNVETGDRDKASVTANKDGFAIIEIDSSLEVSDTDTTIVVKKIIRKYNSTPKSKDSIATNIVKEIFNQNQSDSMVVVTKETNNYKTRKDTLSTDSVEIFITESISLDSAQQTRTEIKVEPILSDSTKANSLPDSLKENSDISSQFNVIPISNDSIPSLDSKEYNSNISEFIKIDSTNINNNKVDSNIMNPPKKNVEIQVNERSKTFPGNKTYKKENEINSESDTKLGNEEYASALLKEIDSLNIDIQSVRASIAELDELKVLTNDDHQALIRLEKMLINLEASTSKYPNEKLESELELLKAQTKELHNKIDILVAKNNVVLVEQKESPKPINTPSDSLMENHANIANDHAPIDSLRSDTLYEAENNVAISDSLERLVNKLQTALDSTINVQKKQENEEHRISALELQFQENQKEALSKQQKLEEEKKEMKEELREKEKKEKDQIEYNKLKGIVEDFGTKSVYFEKNSNEIPSSQIEVVANAVKLLLVHLEITVDVKGFADPSGTKELNLTLAKKRAETIKEFIKTFGISENRITIQSKGEIDYNANSPQQGRRVELKLTLEN